MSEQIFIQAFADAQRHLNALIADQSIRNQLIRVVDAISCAYKNGGKVLVAGNGGSMADSAHFAEELTGKFRGERRALPAMALADASHISCVANDYGFQYVYSRMVDAFGGPQDVVILLSTSGNSANLVEAAHSARRIGCTVVGFLGRGGGALLDLCDVVIMAPGETSDRIQELHMMCLHIVIEAVETQLGLC